jgi:hypothetical protein
MDKYQSCLFLFIIIFNNNCTLNKFKSYSKKSKKIKPMKKILLFAAFLMMAGVAVNAQSDAKKSCDKPCTHSEKASSVEVSTDASTALMAANKDENIEVKTCEDSGTVSFYRKDVCAQSGKVSYTEVEYQEADGTFAVKASNEEKVNTAPAVKKSSCSPSAKASCGSKASGDKGCCSSKATKASLKKGSCCSGSKSTCSSKS